MELSFSKINGTNSFLDYDLFRESILQELQIDCAKAEVLILNNLNTFSSGCSDGT